MHFIEGKAIKIKFLLFEVAYSCYPTWFHDSLYMPCLCILLIIHAYKYKDYYPIMMRRNRNSCQEAAFYVYSRKQLVHLFYINYFMVMERECTRELVSILVCSWPLSNKMFFQSDYS